MVDSAADTFFEVVNVAHDAEDGDSQCFVGYPAFAENEDCVGVGAAGYGEIEGFNNESFKLVQMDVAVNA